MDWSNVLLAAAIYAACAGVAAYVGVILANRRVRAYYKREREQHVASVMAMVEQYEHERGGEGDQGDAGQHPAADHDDVVATSGAAEEVTNRRD